MRTTLVIAAVVGILAAVGGRIYLRSDAGATPAAARTHDAPGETVCANGWVEGARPEVELRPEAAGVLGSVAVDVNDAVTAGMIVAELSNAAQKARVALGRAELEIARQQLEKLLNGEREQKRVASRADVVARKAAHDFAKADHERAVKAGRGSSGQDVDSARSRSEQTKAEWDKAKAELALVEAPPRTEDELEAKARVAVAAAKLREAEAELARTQLKSPVNGRVLERHAEPGAAASPSGGPVLVVADLSKRRVRAFVEELDEARVAAGQLATVTADSRKGRVYTGTVTVVNPRMSKGAPRTDAPNEMKDLHHREVVIDLDAGDDLPPNLLVQVRIQAGAQVER